MSFLREVVSTGMVANSVYLPEGRSVIIQQHHSSVQYPVERSCIIARIGALPVVIAQRCPSREGAMNLAGWEGGGEGHNSQQVVIHTCKLRRELAQALIK